MHSRKKGRELPTITYMTHGVKMCLSHQKHLLIQPKVKKIKKMKKSVDRSDKIVYDIEVAWRVG